MPEPRCRSRSWVLDIRQAFLARAGTKLLFAALALGLCACDVSMTQQKKYKTYAPSSVWRDGASARPLPEGTVARDDLARDKAAAEPPPVTPAVLARGEERFGIFCTPCHGLSGSGDGIVVKRGFPAPPSFQAERLLAMPAAQVFDVISNGYGAMYSYGGRIPPQDRWAIVAYIRALQLAGHATLALAPQAAEKLR